MIACILLMAHAQKNGDTYISLKIHRKRIIKSDINEREGRSINFSVISPLRFHIWYI